MNMQASSSSCDFSQRVWVSSSKCPCEKRLKFCPLHGFSRRMKLCMTHKRKRCVLEACMWSDGGNSNLDFADLATRVAKSSVANRLSNEVDERNVSSDDSGSMGAPKLVSFEEDPIVDKLRTQLGVLHPIPSPPVNKNIVGLFVFFFFVGVVFDKFWTSRKRKGSSNDRKAGNRPHVPTSFCSFLEKDLQRKESVEWVNMVLEKLWKVYKPGLESWLTGLLHPVIDDLEKPDYVERVEIKQLSLRDEPISVRNVERKTSWRLNDLQYQIGICYTGGARMLIMLSLKFGIVPIIDGELWDKLKSIPFEPWVGAVQWAFVSLPKIKFVLSPFRLFNLMGMFLTRLLTEECISWRNLWVFGNPREAFFFIEVGFSFLNDCLAKNHEGREERDIEEEEPKDTTPYVTYCNSQKSGCGNTFSRNKIVTKIGDTIGVMGNTFSIFSYT
ncbi:hypothetical protein DCAR_0726889 [Daucus carota subsp. sativus]|uniref:SMP-LTD domain-containing protein n=2 Tax=Daucus carota subsp. sativus TaxID=79200 RepID=A0AAF1B5L1_DAUCS|nr:hypothetical protein DCAR_0726889 [Daucus carota subsp. sativus]